MPRSKSRLPRWASNHGRPPRCTRQGTDTTLPFTAPYRSVVGGRTREAVSRGRLRWFLFSMTTGRTNFPSSQGSLARRRHDLRRLRLHPQFPGADAARGWSELIEHVDVALADALAAPDLAAGVEARLGPVADRQPRALAEAREHAARRLQREVGVGMELERVLPEEGISQELIVVQLRMIEEGLHADGKDLVLVAHVLGGGGDQVAQAHLQRPRVADDMRLALVVGHLFFELPVLVGAHVDGGAQVVQVEHQAGSVPAEEVGGGRGEMRLGLALVCGELGAKHAEKGLSDVANDLVLGHGRHTATLGGDSPEVSAEVRGLRLFWENSPQSQAVDGRPARRASLLGENRQRIQSSELPPGAVSFLDVAAVFRLDRFLRSL